MFFAFGLEGGETVKSRGKFCSLKVKKDEVPQMNFSVGDYSLPLEWGY